METTWDSLATGPSLGPGQAAKTITHLIDDLSKPSAVGVAYA